VAITSTARLFAAAVSLVSGLAACRREGPRVEATERSAPAEQATAAPSAEHPTPEPDRRWGLALEDAPGRGARVSSVAPSSPASGALQPGDVVRFADGPIRTAADLSRRLAASAPGQPVVLGYYRGDKAFGATVSLPGAVASEHPAAPSAPAPTAPPAGATEAPATRPPTVVVIVPGPTPGPAPAPFYVAGGVEIVGSNARPPAFYAPGLAQTPGATFAPGPGQPIQAYPQLPGISQPPGFRVPLGVYPTPGVPGVTASPPPPGRAVAPPPRVGPSLPRARAR